MSGRSKHNREVEAPTEIDHDELSLPEGWMWASLSDVTVAVPYIKPEDDPDREFNYVDISSICNETFRITDTKSIKGADAPSRARRPVQPNDTLFSNVRTYLRNIAIVDDVSKANVCSTGFTVLRPSETIDSRYLFRYTLSDTFIDLVSPQQTGTHYPATSDRAVLAQRIPLAPLPEQRRIVAKLEQLLAKVSSSQQRLSRIPALLKRFRQSVLAAACSGRLTADWREENGHVEIATELLERLQSERRKAWSSAHPNRKYQEPERLEDDDLEAIPDTWLWTNFDHCASEITVGHVGPMKDRYVDSGVAFLRSQNVRPLRFDPMGLVRIPKDFQAELPKSRLVGGEILVVRSRANTGDCCVFPRGMEVANCADLVITRPLSVDGELALGQFGGVAGGGAGGRWRTRGARGYARRPVDISPTPAGSAAARSAASFDGRLRVQSYFARLT